MRRRTVGVSPFDVCRKQLVNGQPVAEVTAEIVDQRMARSGPVTA
jgi:hypothetical protein